MELYRNVKNTLYDNAKWAGDNDSKKAFYILQEGFSYFFYLIDLAVMCTLWAAYIVARAIMLKWTCTERFAGVPLDYGLMIQM